jgi:hypothetical protein
MSNLTKTVLDYGELVVKQGNIESFTFTSAADEVLKKGVILARDTTTHKLVLYVQGGSAQGNGVPLTVNMSDLEVKTGDQQLRGMTSGIVRKDHLIIAADGDASNVGYAEQDGLRSFNIDVMIVNDQSVIDN